MPVPSKLYPGNICLTTPSSPSKVKKEYRIQTPKKVTNIRAKTAMPKVKRMELYSATPNATFQFEKTASSPYLHTYTGDVKSFLEEESKNPPTTSTVRPYYSHCHTCNNKNLEFEQINDGLFGKKFSEEYWKLQIKTVEKRFYKSFANNNHISK